MGPLAHDLNHPAVRRFAAEMSHLGGEDFIKSLLDQLATLQEVA